MPLRLQVVSAHRESMGGSYVQEFAACGGTIGRSLECDWPLPDSKRYISSKHAMIDYQGGAYYLVDLSRNGVYVNSSDTPVGKGNPQRLFDGDTFRLGEFEIKVAIVEDASKGNDDGMRDPVVRAQLVQEDESIEVAMLPADQINESGHMDAMLKPSDQPDELSGLSEVDSSAIQQLQKNQDAMKEVASAFLSAAGMDSANFSGIDPRDLLQNAARVLSEFIEGTHAMLVSKDRISSQLKLATSSAEGVTNPLRSANGIDNALRLLLGKSNDVSANGTEAVEAAFTELLGHQKAIVAAMKSALAEDNLGDSASGGIPERFDKEFVRAYELETSD
ncbi:MAG: type VI secretion system-associated FHA domain protein TagH [Gammaproteobacteria bacterium]|nr:type VI secretion system-associated FHA domain protein TagH [Gammaproteobacteria bacterium]